MRKYERAALLFKDFPALRQKDIDSCVKKMPHHLLFRHDRTSGTCYACGDTIRNQLYLAGIEHNKSSKCPICKMKVIAMCDSYQYGSHIKRYTQNLVIFRKGKGDICYAHCVHVSIHLHKPDGKPAVESYRCDEVHRYIYTKGEGYRFGRECNGFTNKWGEWEYRTRHTEPVWGNYVFGINADRSYTVLSSKPLRNTCLQYAQLSKMNNILMFNYIGFFLKHPNVEYLIKIGYKDMVQRWFIGNSYYRERVPEWIDWKQNDIRKMLGMNAYELREIQKRYIDLGSYHRIQNELPFLTVDERLEYVSLIRDQYGTLNRFGSDKEKRALLKYLKKQNDRYAKPLRKIYIGDYSDYIRECDELGYDIKDREICFPRCLVEAHQRTTEAVNAIRMERYERQRREQEEKRIQTLQALEENDKLREFRQKLNFSNRKLAICVPESAVEIVKEGAALHHCVGGYAERHARGKLHILFIRQKSEPDVPYYTMEVSMSGEIIQVRGLKNCQPTADVKRIVDAYKEYIKPIFGKEARKTA